MIDCAKFRWLPLLILTAALLGACRAPAQPTALPDTRAATPSAPPSPSPGADAAGTTAFEEPKTTSPVVFGYTHISPDGNRYLPGRAGLPHTPPLELRLPAAPVWLVAAPFEEGALFVAVDAEGNPSALRVSPAGAEPYPFDTPAPAPGQPPLLQVTGSQAALITGGGLPHSPLTHPVVYNPNGGLVFVNSAGTLFFEQPDGWHELAVGALPDARLLQDENGNLLLLGDATTRYAHGVLGDAIEGGAVVQITTQPVIAVARILTIPPPQVAEGLAPLWADLDGDGEREIIVTQSDAAQGAQVVVYNAAGERIAAGQPVGQGSRWRHVLAAAPFGLQGEIEVAEMLTPHLNGRAGFYRLADGELRLVAQIDGLTSHVLGSRNLDMAAAGDFDGDGIVELLVPGPDLTTLNAVRRTESNAEIAWTLVLGSPLSSNLAVARLPGERLVAGAGLADGRLLVWWP